MKITDLIVSAEKVATGERIVGYVCGCKTCATPNEDEVCDRTRPMGLLTNPDEEYGNVRVYTDTMEFVDNPNPYKRKRRKRVYRIMWF